MPIDRRRQEVFEESPIDIAVRDIVQSVSLSMFGNIVAEDGERVNRCKEFSIEVVQRARARGLKAQIYDASVVNLLLRGVSPEFSFGHYFAIVEDVLVEGTLAQFFQPDGSIRSVEYNGDVVKTSAMRSNFPLPQALKRHMFTRLTDANVNGFLDICTDHRSPPVAKVLGIANALR